MQRIIQTVLPPPRRALRLRDFIALAAAMAAFAGLVLYLVLAHIVTFSSPWALALALAMPWVWWMHFAGGGGLHGVRGWTATGTRLAMVGAFAMLLAEPRAVRTNDDLTVIYALDVSDSVAGGAVESAMEFIARTASEKPQSDRAGLVVFGRNAAVELPPRQSFPAEFESINSQVRRDSTDLNKGLSLALAMLPEEFDGRIVLISDGAKTEGEYSETLDRIASRRFPVDVLPIQYQYEHEVWLDKLELPRRVQTGETYEAAVLLSSLRSGRGRFTLSENGSIIFQEDVNYEPGRNRYVLPLVMREPGYYEYVAQIEPVAGQDGRSENNIAVGNLFLEGKGKVLVVIDPSGDPRDWERYVQSLKNAEREVEVRSAFEFPGNALALMPYDSVVFANVAADLFDPTQLQSVKDAVHDQGAGFLMIGGESSFGPGGYHRTAVEEALPVTMDVTQKKVLPKGALAIILHTCEFEDGNTWGKNIAKQAIRVLGAKDEVGVLAYSYSPSSSGEQWVFPMTPAEKYDELAVLINDADLGDMPSFDNTMKLGLEGLTASDASAKHMIIISDGDPSPPTPTLLQKFVTNQISISTVTINPHTGMEVDIMQKLANATGGRAYYPQDPAELPSIFIKEAKTMRRSMIQNKTFTPMIQEPSPILKGITEMPPLHGYVLTTPKPRSLTALKGPEEEEVDPVLSVWRHGIGKSAAFTSDFSTNWGADWAGWEKFDPFIKQLMIDISRSREKSDMFSYASAEGPTGVITVEDFSPKADFLHVEGWVRGPDDRREPVTLRQTGPGRYGAEFPLWGTGRYEVTLLGAGQDRTEQTVCGFAVPYSPEYRRFHSDTPALREIASRTGGRILDGTETGEAIYPVERTARRTSRPIMDWFLIALAVLTPLDVGIRRVQLDKQVMFGWMRRKGRAKPDATLDALLKRKRQADTRMEETRIEAMPPSNYAPAPSVPERPHMGPTPPPEEGPEQDMTTTTGRLLAAKKKWKKEGDQS